MAVYARSARAPRSHEVCVCVCVKTQCASVPNCSLAIVSELACEKLAFPLDDILQPRIEHTRTSQVPPSTADTPSEMCNMCCACGSHTVGGGGAGARRRGFHAKTPRPTPAHNAHAPRAPPVANSNAFLQSYRVSKHFQVASAADVTPEQGAPRRYKHKQRCHVSTRGSLHGPNFGSELSAKCGLGLAKLGMNNDRPSRCRFAQRLHMQD